MSTFLLMSATLTLCLVVAATCLAVDKGSSQGESIQATIPACKTTPITVDGLLNEPAWKENRRIPEAALREVFEEKDGEKRYAGYTAEWAVPLAGLGAPFERRDLPLLIASRIRIMRDW